MWYLLDKFAGNKLSFSSGMHQHVVEVNRRTHGLNFALPPSEGKCQNNLSPTQNCAFSCCLLVHRSPFSGISGIIFQKLFRNSGTVSGIPEHCFRNYAKLFRNFRNYDYFLRNYDHFNSWIWLKFRKMMMMKVFRNFRNDFRNGQNNFWWPMN